MPLVRQSDGSVARLANGGIQQHSAECVPCCAPAPCETCCYRVTFTGVTIATARVYTQIDNAYEAHFDESENPINGVGFIVCDTGDSWNFIPAAAKTHLEDPGGGDPRSYACGYFKVRCHVDGTNIQVSLYTDYGVVEQNLELFYATIPIGEKSTACGSTDTFTSANQYDSDPEVGGFSNADGSVLVEIVPTCDGANPVFSGPDCATSELFGQTICDEDDCPCGRADAQPTCVQVTLNDSTGTPAVYQNGTLVSGTDDRNYIFSGPYRRGDGTWWRFLVVADDPDVAAWNGDFAYFEHQCPGDGLDSYSGTYTVPDAADWTDSNPDNGVSTTLITHQTALTNLGTTVTVSDCECSDADEVYTVSVRCDPGDSGTSPSGWVDIAITRVGDSCTWTGSNANYSVSLTYTDGVWYAVVTETSTSEIMDGHLTASGADPTGTYPFEAAIPPWDELPDCSGLAIVVF